VKNIRNGFGSFHPDEFDACAAAWSALAQKCSMSVVEFAKTYRPCQQLLVGGAKPGERCTQDSDCAAAEGAYASCEGNTCINTFIVGEGTSCAYGGVTRNVCDDGLYCPLSPPNGPTPTCRKATASGQSCSGPIDPSCGFGHACTDYVCGDGLPGGSACSYDQQCASWSCKSNKCADYAVTLGQPLFCGGSKK
jgi:hypothetical protein